MVYCFRLNFDISKLVYSAPTLEKTILLNNCIEPNVSSLQTQSENVTDFTDILLMWISIHVVLNFQLEKQKNRV